MDSSGVRASAAVVGRLAPTPSGYLHLGIAVNFVLTWLLVRRAMRPLERLTATAGAIAAAQDHTRRVPVTGPPDAVTGAFPTKHPEGTRA